MTTARDGRIITFYSYKGGVGRSMALANTAWILAANGRRVLAVDWDLEAPGLEEYFRPFLAADALVATTGVIDIIFEYAWAVTDGTPRSGRWHEEYARVEQHAVSLAPERYGLRFPEGGSLDFLSAGRQDRAYSARVSAFDWDAFYERLGGGMFLDAMRDSMKRSYDYVLLDSRTGNSDHADICTLQMPDVLVDCFTIAKQSISGALEIARAVADGHRGRAVRVFPVLTRVGEGEKEKEEAGRAEARLRFHGFPRDLRGDEANAYWNSVQIPHRPYYAGEEMLATIGDEPGDAGSLLSAFERLTAVVSDGEVTAMPPIPEPVRQRCVRAFRRPRPQTVAADLTVAYAPENRLWAEWVAGLLRRVGGDVTLHDVSLSPLEEPDPARRTVVLLSKAFQKSRYGDAVWRALADEAIPHGTAIPVRIDGVWLSPDLEPTAVDLNQLDRAACVTRLFDALDLPGPEVDGTLSEPRFPGLLPRIWNLPPRNPAFTGRNAVLERIREQLGGGVFSVVPQHRTLSGLGGIGKTQIALEYAHRFLADYDLVWWTPAEHVDTVAVSLAELATRIGVSDTDDITRSSRQAVARLASGEARLPTGEPIERWLLVFDNADTPEALAPFLPAGGHVLVTSRNQAWAQRNTVQSVDVFLREESVEHLTLRVHGLTPEAAGQVAAAVGDLPLAVEQAAAWLAETLTPVDAYVRQLDEQTTHVLDLSRPGDYPMSVATTWNVSIAHLRERSPAAARLLELCAFLAPEPVHRDLLYSRAMIEALKPYDPALQESLLLGLVIREIGRFALAKVGRSGIQVHRLVQAVIRSQLSEAEQRQTRHIVHTVLAGARPDGDEPIDDPATWRRFQIIWPHLAASDARDCTDPETRRLLIDRVRYLWKRGDFTGARALAEDLLERWLAALGEDDLQYLYLRGQFANVLRSQGHYTEASEVDRDLLQRQRRVLGATHPHAYVTMSGLSSDLAALGRYMEAVNLAREAHEGFRQIFHESHPRTLSAANNLALALHLVGLHNEALGINQDTLERRTEILGPDHPYTLASAERLGRDLREVGRYADSMSQLSRAYEAHKRVMGKTFPGTLRCAVSLAVSLRRNGQFEDARRLTTATRAEYLARYEKPTPDSLACDLNLAADLFAADEREAARDTALEVLGEYMKVPGEAHPDTQTALSNLGVFHWGCGELDEAERVFSKVLPRMTEVLGAEHPHTLFSTVNYANVLFDSGRFEEAGEAEERAVTSLRQLIGARHPDTLAVVTNRALTLRAQGHEEEARRMSEEALAELRMLLGDDTGITRRAGRGLRIYRDLEPLRV